MPDTWIGSMRSLFDRSIAAVRSGEGDRGMDRDSAASIVTVHIARIGLGPLVAGLIGTLIVIARVRIADGREPLDSFENLVRECVTVAIYGTLSGIGVAMFVSASAGVLVHLATYPVLAIAIAGYAALALLEPLVSWHQFAGVIGSLLVCTTVSLLAERPTSTPELRSMPEKLGFQRSRLGSALAMVLTTTIGLGGAWLCVVALPATQVTKQGAAIAAIVGLLLFISDWVANDRVNFSLELKDHPGFVLAAAAGALFLAVNATPIPQRMIDGPQESAILAILTLVAWVVLAPECVVLVGRRWGGWAAACGTLTVLGLVLAYLPGPDREAKIAAAVTAPIALIGSGWLWPRALGGAKASQAALGQAPRPPTGAKRSKKKSKA